MISSLPGGCNDESSVPISTSLCPIVARSHALKHPVEDRHIAVIQVRSSGPGPTTLLFRYAINSGYKQEREVLLGAPICADLITVDSMVEPPVRVYSIPSNHDGTA